MFDIVRDRRSWCIGVLTLMIGCVWVYIVAHSTKWCNCCTIIVTLCVTWWPWKVFEFFNSNWANQFCLAQNSGRCSVNPMLSIKLWSKLILHCLCFRHEWCLRSCNFLWLNLDISSSRLYKITKNSIYSTNIERDTQYCHLLYVMQYILWFIIKIQ